MNAHDILILRALQHAQRKHLAVGGNPGDRATGAAPGSAAEASRGSSGSQGSGTSGGWQGGNSGAQGSGTSGGWQGGGGGGNVGAEHGGSGAGGASGPEADRDRQAGEAAGQTKASSGLGGNAQPTGSPAGGFRGASGSNMPSIGGTQPGAPTGVSPATTGWAGGFSNLMDSLRDAMAAAQAPTPSIQGPIRGMSFNGPMAPSAPALNTSSYPKTETSLKEMQENFEKEFNKTSGLGTGTTPPSTKQFTERIEPEATAAPTTSFEQLRAANALANANALAELQKNPIQDLPRDTYNETTPVQTGFPNYQFTNAQTPVDPTAAAKPGWASERIPDPQGKYQGTLGDEGSLAAFGEAPQPTTDALGDWNQTKPDFPMGGTDITGDMPDFDTARTGKPYAQPEKPTGLATNPTAAMQNMDVMGFDPISEANRLKEASFVRDIQNAIDTSVDPRDLPGASLNDLQRTIDNSVNMSDVFQGPPSSPVQGNVQDQITGPVAVAPVGALDDASRQLADQFNERMQTAQMPSAPTTQPGAYDPARLAEATAASAALQENLNAAMAAAQAQNYENNISGMSFNPSVPSAPSPTQAAYEAQKTAFDAGTVKPATEKTVQPGDTLSGIARKNNVSVSDLMDANPQIKDPNKIAAGQKINVPSVTKTQKAKTANQVADFGPTPDQMREYYDKAVKVAQAINEPGLVGWIGRQMYNAEVARQKKAAEDENQGYKGNWAGAPNRKPKGAGGAAGNNGGGHEDQRDKSGNATGKSGGPSQSEESSDASSSSEGKLDDKYLHLLPDSPAYVPYSLPDYNASIGSPGLVSPQIAQFNAMQPPAFNIAPSQYAPQQNQQQNNLTGNDAFANAMRLIRSGTAY